MKVLLANAPWRKEGFYGVRAGSRWPHFQSCDSNYMPFPFFLAYAAAVLERAGFDVSLLDAVAHEWGDDQFYRRMADERPDLVLFEVSTPSIATDLEHARRTKLLLGKDVSIAFAGPHSEMFDPAFLRKAHDVDFVLVGEYEFTSLDLAEHLRDGLPLGDVQGLLFRGPNGEAVANPTRPLERDLEKFPWPARDSLPMEKYIDAPGGLPLPCLQMWASRGCPFKCIFCAWPQIMYGGNKYRTRKPLDVVDEICLCVERYGIRSVYFDDDTFNIGKKRILRLAGLMKERVKNIPWAIMARADTMTPQMLEEMKNGGLVALKYGVESANQQLLDSARKSLSIEKVKDTVEYTRQMGISYHLTFMFGLPGETIETARRTIDLALELDPDSVQFSIATPYPGSEYFHWLQERGYLLSRNYEEYDGYHSAVIRTDALGPRQLEEIVREANRKWHAFTLRRKLKAAPFKGLAYALRYPRMVPLKVRQLLGLTPRR